MSTKIIARQGSVISVYDDRFLPILQALGTVHITRATDVEYDESTGDWIGTHRATGQIIARGKTRATVIQQEVAWLEKNIESHS